MSMFTRAPLLASLLALAACGASPAAGSAAAPASPRQRMSASAPAAAAPAAAAPASAPVAENGPPASAPVAESGPPASAPVAESGPPAPAPRPPTAAMRALLAAHNAARRRHCAPPLTWSPALAGVAQRWADHLASHGCGFAHSGGRYGENLAAASAGALTPAGVVTMWASERHSYDFRRGGFSMHTGHFTQLVWRATRHVGCGHSSCRGMDLWVCEYDPAGNVDGEYRPNVLPASCHR